jgi:hypothetical protein
VVVGYLRGYGTFPLHCVALRWNDCGIWPYGTVVGSAAWIHGRQAGCSDSGMSLAKVLQRRVAYSIIYIIYYPTLSPSPIPCIVLYSIVSVRHLSKFPQ